MTLSLYGKSRRRQGSLLLLGVLAVFAAIVGGMSLYRSDPATAAPIVIVDDGGANDEVGQKDLNLLTVDYAGLPTTIAVGWNWDEPSVSGGNSLDACSLYDTDGDGNANYAVCGVAHFTGDPPVAAASTAVWSCSDNRDDRCTAPNAEIPSALSSCAIAVSNDDPFLAGDHSPQDLKATCNVLMSDVGGSSAGLINVCSYESSSPTSNPEDCVLAPSMRAQVTVIKNVAGGPAVASDFQITLSATNVMGGPATFPGEVAPGTSRSVTAGTFSLTETLAPDYEFTSIVGTGCPAALGESAAIAAEASVTCTITNTYAPTTRTIEVCKVVVDNGDGVTDGGRFAFDLGWSGTGQGTILVGKLFDGPHPMEGDAEAICTTFEAPADQDVTVVERNVRPGGDSLLPGSWNGDDPLYPQNTRDGLGSKDISAKLPPGVNTVTFHNKTLPRDKGIVIEKRFVELPAGYTPDSGDYPTFTFDPAIPGFDFAADCTVDASGLPGMVRWACTVPYGWNGQVTETPADGWDRVLDCEAPTDANFVFCNEPYAEVTVQKVFTGNLTGKSFSFTGSAGLPVLTSPIAGGNNTTSTVLARVKVAPGSYSLTETNGKTFAQGCQGDLALPFGYQTQAETTVDSLPGLARQVVGASPVNITLAIGEEGVVTFYNEACAVAGSPVVIIEKFADPAGNRTGVNSIAGFQIRVWNNGSEIANSPFASTGAQIVIPGLDPGTVIVQEVNPNTGGWKFTGSKTDRGNNGSFEASVSGQPAQEALNLSDAVRFNFYNQPRVNIEVNKTEISLATPAGAPGNLWSFTLTGCGIVPQVAATGINGQATFSDLPPASGCSYTVTETVKAGWSAINPVQVTAPTAAGQVAVLNFTNVKIEVPDITPTPVPPTETPVPPTATPEPPETPTEEAVAGEKTPGPTPLAPVTGTGAGGDGGTAGMNILLLVVGLAVLSGGLTVAAAGKRRHN